MPELEMWPLAIAKDDVAWENLRKTLHIPMNAFEAVMTADIFQLIADQTNLYAQQKGHSLAKVTADEIKTFVFIVMLSGYIPVPQRRLLWSDGLDCHNTLVTGSMRVNRFEEIMRNLHVANNAHIDDDHLYKVRPIINAINAAGKIIAFSSNLSVDESMLP